MKLKSGHEVIQSGDEESDEPKFRLIYLNPQRWCMLPEFIDYADKFYEFEFRPSDIVLITFPKCGTTFAQEILWTMMHNPNLDNPRAKASSLARCPFLEFDVLLDRSQKHIKETGTEDFFECTEKIFQEECPDKDPNDGLHYQLAKYASDDPRIIKTHLPLSLLPPKMLDTCKVVYVARNPKDACISLLHHLKLMKNSSYPGTLDNFINSFTKDEILYMPFWEHVKEAWERRHHSNMLWIFFEDLNKMPLKVIKEMDKFLQTNLSEEQLKNIEEYTNFDCMKKREEKKLDSPLNLLCDRKFKNNEGGFFRKGISGTWRTTLSLEQNEKFDKWIQENSKGLNIPFTY